MELIPFNSLEPQHDASVADALLSVLRDNKFILGERLTRFESEFAAFTGVRHCIGTGNGHDALVLSLRALGLGTKPGDARGRAFDAKGPGTEPDRMVDEVIVPANTYVATWLAVTNAGCIPVPVEPDPDTHNIDPTRIEERITPRTRAIMPVHLYGNPCDMQKIVDTAGRFGLRVVEDNAQAHGACLLITDSVGASTSRVTGSFGQVNATSFYPTKNVGALGDGGAVTTDDDEVAARLRKLRNYGFSSRTTCEEIGINSRLDEIQAVVLSVKLSRLNARNDERRSIAAVYNDRLHNVGDLILQSPTPGGTHVYHLYVVRTHKREQLRSFLEREGIQTAIHYPIAPHMQKAYKALGYERGAFPVAERLAEEVVSLPIWPGMREEQVERVWKAVRRFY